MVSRDDLDRLTAERIAPLTLAMLDSITEAYCDANMKCDDDTGLYDAQPDCQAKKAAARVWLAVTGVGLLIAEIDRLTAERVAARRFGAYTAPRYAALQAAQSRADGYALLVAEYRTALERAGTDLIGFEGYFERIGSMGTVASIRVTLDMIDALLAADPEARAAELLARGE